MHYHMEVYIKDLKNVDKQIETILAPYDENLEVEEYQEDGETYHRNPKGLWDWYQIGGRWTGSHDGYDPYKDERNWERCDLCHGTGFRNDSLGMDFRIKEPSYTCNGCGRFNDETKRWEHGEQGKGKRMKWATDWVRNFGDISPINEIKDDLSCSTLIVGESMFCDEIWDGEHWIKTDFTGNVKCKLTELNITEGYLVTVDYHS